MTSTHDRDTPEGSPAARFAQWAERTSFLGGITFSDSLGVLAMAGERPRDDVDRPGERLMDALQLDFAADDLGETRISRDQYVRDCMVLWVTDALHEFAEFFKIDGERVFEPHAGYDSQFDIFTEVLAEIADDTAVAMLQRHPRHEPEPAGEDVGKAEVGEPVGVGAGVS